MRPMGNGNDAPVTVALAVALGASDWPVGNALAKRPGVFVGGSAQQFVDAIVPAARKPVRAGGGRSMKPNCGGPGREPGEQTQFIWGIHQ